VQVAQLLRQFTQEDYNTLCDEVDELDPLDVEFAVELAVELAVDELAVDELAVDELAVDELAADELDELELVALELEALELLDDPPLLKNWLEEQLLQAPLIGVIPEVAHWVHEVREEQTEQLAGQLTQVFPLAN